MLTIEGLCEQLRRFNVGNGCICTIEMHPDTSCYLIIHFCGPQLRNKIPEMARVQRKLFPNHYQLMEFFTKHTGVRS